MQSKSIECVALNLGSPRQHFLARCRQETAICYVANLHTSLLMNVPLSLDPFDGASREEAAHDHKAKDMVGTSS